MTRERFNAIMSSLSCDWEEFSDLLRQSWVNCITECDHFVVDEAIFAFETQTGPTYPKSSFLANPIKMVCLFTWQQQKQRRIILILLISN